MFNDIMYLLLTLGIYHKFNWLVKILCRPACFSIFFLIYYGLYSGWRFPTYCAFVCWLLETNIMTGELTHTAHQKKELAPRALIISIIVRKAKDPLSFVFSCVQPYPAIQNNNCFISICAIKVDWFPLQKKAIMCLPQNQHFLVSVKMNATQRRILVSPSLCLHWYGKRHLSGCGQLKSVALTIVKSCCQSVENFRIIFKFCSNILKRRNWLNLYYPTCLGKLRLVLDVLWATPMVLFLGHSVLALVDYSQ